jgi:predicted amidophosphoribosyltransferase
MLELGASCANQLCRSPDRQFKWAVAIAMKKGPLERAIITWKDDKNKWGWGLIFSRVVLGFLQDKEELFREFDVIIPSPAYRLTAEVTYHDHTAYVIGQAARQDTTGLPFRATPPLITKRWATPRMRGAGGRTERERIAVHELRPALSVPDPSAVVGLRILVYDDVLTTGSSLNETARALREAGADTVCQVTLARQTWTT